MTLCLVILRYTFHLSNLISVGSLFSSTNLICVCQLFVIEGDYIQLREGAQEIIAATAAVAKVAAAAAATSSYSSVLPSVAVTPMAQSHRLKKAPSVDSTSGKSESNMFKEYSVVQSTPSNGVSFNIAGGVPNIKILSKSKDHLGMNGSETRSGQSVPLTVGNGTNSDKNDFGSSPSKGSIHWRANANIVGKPQGRYFFKLNLLRAYPCLTYVC